MKRTAPIPMPVALSTGPWLITPEGASAVRAAFATPPVALGDYEDDEGGDDESPFDLVDGVARIRITGPLFATASFWSWLCGGLSYQQIAAAVRAADADLRVKTIVLDVDSPGGEVNGVQGAAFAVASVGKPLTVFVGGSCCSAAYWIASGAKRIVASPTAIIGSIGVYGRLADERADAKDYDDTRIRTVIASQSPRKLPDFDADGGMADVQRQIDDLCAVFVETVAAGRGITTDQVLERYGQGAAFVAARALGAGLIDEVADAADTWLSVGRLSPTESKTPGDARALTEEALMGVTNIPAAALSPGMTPVADAAGAKDKVGALREHQMAGLKMLDEIDAELGDAGGEPAAAPADATGDAPAAKSASIVARIGALKARASQADALAQRVAALEADAAAKAEAARIKERDALISQAIRDERIVAGARTAWLARADKFGNAEVAALLAELPAKGVLPKVRGAGPDARPALDVGDVRTPQDVSDLCETRALASGKGFIAEVKAFERENPDLYARVYGGVQ